MAQRKWKDRQTRGTRMGFRCNRCNDALLLGLNARAYGQRVCEDCLNG